MALSVSETLSLARPARRRQIWSVGGGKGGIGKSLIAASIGWQLARMGQQVVLVDADLGGANLHTCLGLSAPERTLADFVRRRVDTLEEALVDTGVPRLRLLSGAEDMFTAANIKHMQKVRVLRRLRDLDVDVVLIDVGAGTSFNSLDFFLLSDVAILAAVPEPSSIENGYRFVKSALYRKLRSAAPSPEVRELVDAASDPRNELGLRTPVDLLARVEQEDAEAGATLRREASAFRPRLVINEVRDERDIAIGHQLVAACQRHLGLQASYAGYVHYEDAVWRTVRRRRLFMADAPTSRAAEEIRRITRDLFKGRGEGPDHLMERGGDDLYDVLGLQPGAAHEQIERAYRFCLDMYGDGALATYTLLDPVDLERVRSCLRKAHEVLTDPERRRAYDEVLGFSPPEAQVIPFPAARPSGEEEKDELPEVLTGPDLKRIREARGVSLRQMSNITKIGTRFLEYIEADHFTFLPAPIYLKGFLKEYARMVSLDPRRVSEAYMKRLAPSG
jgi:flagellar biosynthesis protein FlhG